MNDDTTPIASLKQWMTQFVAERDWQVFHTPKNLSMSLAIEAAELMEHFQWLTTDESLAVRGQPEKRSEVADELADVLCYAVSLANALDIDIATAVYEKMKKNAVKYPPPAK